MRRGIGCDAPDRRLRSVTMNTPLYVVALVAFALAFLAFEVFLTYSLMIALAFMIIALAAELRVGRRTSSSDVVTDIVFIGVTWLIFVLVGPRPVPVIGVGLRYAMYSGPSASPQLGALVLAGLGVELASTALLWYRLRLSMPRLSRREWEWALRARALGETQWVPVLPGPEAYSAGASRPIADEEFPGDIDYLGLNERQVLFVRNGREVAVPWEELEFSKWFPGPHRLLLKAKDGNRFRGGPWMLGESQGLAIVGHPNCPTDLSRRGRVVLVRPSS